MTDTYLRKPTLAAGLILVLTLAAYANSFNAAFHFDDTHQVVMNEHIRDLSNLPRFFTDIRFETSSTSQVDFFRPITIASLAVNYAVSGYDTWSYHLVNISLHFLNSLLFYLVLRAVLRRAGHADYHLLSLFIALAFALHPIQTGAVTYISGRAVLLASFFYLLAFYCFVRYRTAGAGRGYYFAAAAPVLYLMGLLSKEMAVSLPAMLLLYDMFFTFPREGKSWRHAAYYIPFMLALASFLAVRKHQLGSAIGSGADYGAGYYLLSQAKALLMYVRLLFLPMNQNFDYAIPLTKALDTIVLLSGFLCLLAASLLYRSRKNDPALGFFGLWSFIALAPESSLVPIADVAVEYRLYLPLAGFVAAMALLAAGMLKRPALLRGAAVSVLVLMAALTLSRNAVWATEATLWGDAVKKSPGSARAHLGLGKAMYEEGRYPECVDAMKRSLDIDPENPMRAHMRDVMGICYSEMGMVAEAASEFEESLKAFPGYFPVRYNLAECYRQLGRYAEARAALEGLAEEAPDDFSVRYSLALTYEDTGMMARAREQASALARLAVDDEQRGNAEDMLMRLEGGGLTPP